MEGAATRLCFHFNGAGAVAAVLRTVIGSKNLKLGNGLGIGIDVQRAIGAVVHVVAAVQFPVVVFGPATVHAVGNVAVHTDLAFIRTGLIHDTRT